MNWTPLSRSLQVVLRLSLFLVGSVCTVTAGDQWRRDPVFATEPLTWPARPTRVTAGPDGKLYVSFNNGGYLSGAAGRQLGAVVRLQADGTVDESFSLGARLTSVWAIAFDAEGRLLVGGQAGDETAQTGYRVYRVFRFTADGRPDPTYRSPVFGGIPRFMTLQPDGRLLVVPSGNNGENGGIVTLARLNSDGSRDATFAEPALGGGSRVIFAPPVVDTAGKVYVGGVFNQVNGVARPAVARLNADGSLDETWVPSGFSLGNENQHVRGLALQTQGANAGKLLVAGGAMFVPGSGDAGANRPVVRLLADGAIDSSFTLVTQAEAGQYVRPRLLEVAADDSFTVVGGTVAKFSANGALVDAGTFHRAEFSTEFFWQATLADGSIVVPAEAGASVDGQPVDGLVKLKPDGNVDPDFVSPGFIAHCYPSDIVAVGTGDFLSWGQFNAVGAVTRPGLARFHADGGLDLDFAPTAIAFPSFVRQAQVSADGRILVVTSNDVDGSSNLLRLQANGAVDAGFTLDASVAAERGGLSLWQAQNGKVLIWGADAQRLIDGTAGLRRLNADGTVDHSFDANGLPLLGQVFRDGSEVPYAVTLGSFQILAEDAAGRFIAATTNGSYAAEAASLEVTLVRINANGSRDTSFVAPSRSWSTSLGYPIVSDGVSYGGSSFQVAATAVGSPFSGASVQADGKVLVFGLFTDLAGHPTPGLARLNADGSFDSSFTAGAGAQWLGTPGRSAQVTGVTAAGNGGVWVSGYFDTFDGVPASGLVLLDAAGRVVPGYSTDVQLLPYIGGDVKVAPVDNRTVLVAGSMRAVADGAFPVPFERLVQTPPPAGEPDYVWRNPQPAGGTLHDVVFGGGRFVAVGAGGRTVVSDDGFNWLPAAATGEDVAQAVAFDGERYWAVGAAGAIYASNTLTQWDFVAREPNYNWLNGLSIVDGTKVAVGANGVIMRAAEGGSWAPVNTPTHFNLNAVAGRPGSWVAAGDNGALLHATDGTDWTVVTPPSGFETWRFQNVKYVNGQFFVMGGSGQLLASADGLSWTPINTGTPHWFNDISFDGTTYLLTAGFWGVVHSTDLVNWTESSLGQGLEGAALMATAASKGGIVVVGAGGAILRSTDGGQSWVSRGASGGLWEMTALESFGDELIAVGANGFVFHSDDGRQWERLHVGDFEWLQGVARHDDLYVVAGGGGDFWLTGDGQSWTRVDPDNFGENGGLTYGAGEYLAVGANGVVRRSADGSNWTSTELGGNWLRSVAVMGEVRIAVGDGGRIVRSTDGVNWSEQSGGNGANLQRVRALDGRFIALGDNHALLLSVDGISWQSIPTPNNYARFGWNFTDVARGPDGYYLVNGQGNVIRTIDFRTFVSLDKVPAGTPLRGIGFVDGTMAVVGEGGSIITAEVPSVSTAVQFASGGLPALSGFLPGDTIMLGAYATGAEPLSYQWFKDGDPIAGAIYPLLQAGAFGAATTGRYTLQVTNGLGQSASTSTQVARVGYPLHGGPFYGVGDLPGGATFSEVRDATRVDGVIVAVGGSGQVPNGFSSDRGIIWRSDEGLTPLPNLVENAFATSFIAAGGITPDGAYIASRTRPTASGGLRHAARYATSDLSILSLGEVGEATGISAASLIADDGAVLYGFAQDGTRAFRYEVAGPTAERIPLVGDGHDQNYPGFHGTSADGAVLIGVERSSTDANPARAFRYVHGDGVTLLPLLAGGSWNEGLAVTPDGNTAVLRGDSAAFGRGEVYLHHADSGEIEALGSPDAGLVPTNVAGITADGAVVVTYFFNEQTGQSWSYLHNANGWFRLQPAIAALAGADLTGWDLDGVFGVSRDGTLVFGQGQHQGHGEGFVAALPAGYLADYAGVSPVRIFAQPQSVNVGPDRPVTLRVGIEGALDGLGFQWFRDGSAVPEATGPELIVAADSAGNYFVRITQDGKVVDSAVATVAPALAGNSWLVDDGYAAPAFQWDTWAGRVTPDGAGNLYATWVNGANVTGADGQQVGTVIRLRPDGSLDPLFSVDTFLSDAWAVQPLADGSVLVGGLAATENSQTGLPLFRVFRFSGSGALDPGYRSPVFGGLPRFMTLQPDGKLLVVATGNNAANGGIPALARLNPDGSLDSEFHQVGVDADIFAPPVVAPDGKIYVGGFFTQVDGVARSGGVARLNADGTLDQTWVPSGYVRPNGTFDQIRGLALQQQGANAGKLVIAGGVMQVPGGTGDTTNRPVIRLNLDGSVDPSFTLLTQGDLGMTPRPRLLALRADDRIVVMGRTVALLTANGAVDGSYTRPTFSAEAFWMAALPDGSVVVPPEPGMTVNGQGAPSLVKFGPDGTPAAGFAAPRFNVEFYPNRFHAYGDGRALVWGGFNHVNGQTAPGLVRLRADGSLDDTFQPQVAGYPSFVTFAEVGSDGRILTTVRNNASGARSLVLLDDAGAVNNAFALDAVVNQLPGFETKLLPDNRVMVWSASAQAVLNGTAGLVRLSATGTLDPTFTSTGQLPALGTIGRNGGGVLTGLTLGHFRVLAVDGSGRAIARSTVGALPLGATTLEATLLRFNADGTFDGSFAAPSLPAPTFVTYPTVSDAQTNGGALGQVETRTANSPFEGVLVQADGRLIVYGLFSELGGLPRAGLARLNPNGSLDTTFDVGSGAQYLQSPGRLGQVTHVRADDDGSLWISGYFDSFNGHAAPGLVRLDATGAVSAGFATELALQPYVGTNTMVAPDGRGGVLVAGTYGRGGASAFPAALHRLVKADSLPVQIDRQPAPYTAAATGSTVTLEARMTVPGDYAVQWYHNGQLISGANALRLVLTHVTSADAGSYYATITGAETFTTRPAEVAIGSAADSAWPQFTWHNPVPTGGDLEAVIHDGTRFVAAGSGGRVLTSSDGLTWTTAAGVVPHESTRGLFFTGSQYLAVGASGAIYGSADLSAWTLLGRETNFGWINAIARSGGTYVAPTDQGTIVTSSDGTTWTTINPGANARLLVAAAGGGQFVVAGDNGRIMRSTDGQSWTTITPPAGYESRLFQACAYLNGAFFLAGGNGGLLRSTDGLDWTPINTGAGHWFTGIAYDGTNYVLSAGYRVFVTSPDLVNWTEHYLDDARFNGAGFNALVAAGGQLVAVGVGGGIQRSTDHGAGWTSVGAVGGRTELTTVVYRNGRFVVVGSDGGIFTSPDGMVWNRSDTQNGPWLTGVDYGAGAYVAVSRSGTVLRSTDGAAWSQVEVGDYDETLGVVFAGGEFTAVGNAGLVRRSLDGLHWTTLRLSGGRLNAVAVKGNVRVAVGDNGRIMRSTNGSDWTDQSVGGPSLHQVRALDDMFIAVGDNRTVLLSQNGIDWLPVAVPNDYNAYGWGYQDVARGPDGYVIVGSQGRVVTTTNFRTWTSAASMSALNNLQGVTMAQGRVVVVGDGGAILSASVPAAPSIPLFVGGGLPAELSIVSGGASVTLGAYAVGTGPLTYQWQHNGTDLVDATQPVYVLDEPSSADVGTYTLVVRDGAGHTVSTTTQVVVAGLPEGSGPLYGIGDLPGGANFSEVRDAIRVGDVIVAVGGSARNPNGFGADTAVVWTSDEGLQVLPDLVTNNVATSFVTASAITPDAAYIAARARAFANNGQRYAVRHRTEDGSVLSFGALGGFNNYSVATAISDDGAVLYGFGQDANFLYRALRYEASGPTTTAIPLIGAVHNQNFVAPRGTSADGSVAVGNQSASDGSVGTRAFRYVHGVGTTLLPLPPGGTWSEALDVTPDGNTTLVRGDAFGYAKGCVYLHDATRDTLTMLGSPSTAWTPLNSAGITADASVVIMTFFDPVSGAGAVYFHNPHGWFDLRALMRGAEALDLTGWEIDGANGVSRDGTLIFGRARHEGNDEGYVLDVPAGLLAGFDVVAQPPSAARIIGTWSTGDALVAFLADGTYYHLQVANAEDVSEGGASGFERGTYTWDETTGAFTVTTRFDTNGDIGLGDANGEAGLNLSVDGDQLTFRHPGENPVVLTRLVGGAASLVGGWHLADGGPDSGVFVAFLADGTYLLADEGEPEATGYPGFETGSYTWNPVTHAFAVSDIAVDDNGDWGLSHITPAATMTLSADLRTLTFADGEDGGVLTRVAASVPFGLTTQPADETVTEAGQLLLSVQPGGAGPFSYQWRHDGQVIAGSTGATLTLSGLTTADAGVYDVVVTSPLGVVVSAPATVVVNAAGPVGRALMNLSVRQDGQPGQTLFLPFRIEGTGNKSVLLRAVGPTLVGFGLQGAMPDPRIRLVDHLGAPVAANDDWANDPTVAQTTSAVGAFGLNSDSADAALVTSIAPGSYVMMVEGAVGGTVITEIYDADAGTPTSRLVFLGALGNTGSGASLAASFVVSPTQRQVLLRGVGPGLGLNNAIPDPQLATFVSGQQTASNDNWGGTNALQSAFATAGATPLAAESLDAVLQLALAPGGYTAQVQSGNSTAGRALFELFDLEGRTPPVAPVLLVPTVSQTVQAGQPARFEVLAAGAQPIAYQWYHNDSLLSGETSPVLNRSAVQAADAGDYTVRLTNSAGAYFSTAATLTVESGPEITQQPMPVTVDPGQTATLSVMATGTAGPLQYQWYQGTSGNTAAPIEGATSASYTPLAPSVTTSYWVRVSDGVGSVDSATVMLTVRSSTEIVATHAVVGAGYRAGGTVTITTTLTYTIPASALGWSVVLPDGWDYASTAGDDVADIKPKVGDTGTLSWAFTSAPQSPVSFTYTLNVPAGTTGDVPLTAQVLFFDTDNGQSTVAVTPSPLILTPAPSLHDADTSGDHRIDLPELLRVIQLYNTRFGTTRTGRYQVSAGTADGFGTDATLDNNATVTLERYHSADTNRDGKLDLSELLRVIQLYNYRAGTVRTGEYHVEPGTSDGFGAGPEV